MYMSVQRSLHQMPHPQKNQNIETSLRIAQVFQFKIIIKLFNPFNSGAWHVCLHYNTIKKYINICIIEIKENKKSAVM